jgi:hypothetical protein
MRNLLRVTILSICFLTTNSSFAAIEVNTLRCEDESKTIQLESNRSANGVCFFPIDQWTIEGESFLEPVAYCAEFAPEVITGGYTSRLVRSEFDLESYIYVGHKELADGSELLYNMDVLVRHHKSGSILFAGKLNCSLTR